MNQRLKLALSIGVFLPVIFACSPASPQPLSYRPPPTPIAAELVADTQPILVDGQLRSINLSMLPDEIQWIGQDTPFLVLADWNSLTILDAKTLAKVGYPPTLSNWRVATSPLTSTIAFAEFAKDDDSPEQITVLNISTQRILKKVPLTLQDRMSRLVLSPNGQWLAVHFDGPENRIAVFDVRSGKQTVSLNIPNDPREMHFSVDSTDLFAYEVLPAEKAFVRLHSIALPSGAATQRDVDTPPDWFGLAKVSPDNRMVRLSDGNCGLVIFDIATGKTRSFESDCNKPKSNSAFNADSSRIAVGYENGGLKLLDAHSFESMWSSQAYIGPVEQIQFSPDQTLIATANKLEGIKIWSAQSGALLRVIDPYAHTMSISPNGKQMVTIGTGYVKVWDLITGQLLRASHRSNFSPNNAVFYSPDGKRIAYELEDLVLIRDAHSGALTAQCAFALPKALLGFSSAGERFALYENYSAIMEYNAQTCQQEHQYSIPFVTEAQRQYEVTYNAEQAILALPEFGRALSLYDASTGASLGRLTQPSKDGASTTSTPQPLEHIAISPNGQYVAAADTSGKVYLWEVASGKFVATTHLETRLHDLIFLRDSQRLVLTLEQNTGYFAASLRLWDVKRGALKPLLPGQARDSDQIRSFIFDDANDRTITFSRDGQLQVWDVSTGQLIRTQKLDLNGDIVALRPDGKQLIIQGDSRLQLVDLP